MALGRDESVGSPAAELRGNPLRRIMILWPYFTVQKPKVKMNAGSVSFAGGLFTCSSRGQSPRSQALASPRGGLHRKVWQVVQVPNAFLPQAASPSRENRRYPPLMRLVDTSPAVQRKMDEHYRQMSPIEKCAVVRSAWRTARALQLAGLRERFPGESEEELELRLAELWLGDELFKRVRAWQSNFAHE